MKKILILKTGRTVESMPQALGDFEDWIITGMALPANKFCSVSVFIGDELPSLDSISAIIITGSPAMVTDKLDWIESSMRYIKAAVEKSMPILGICFGHQLLAQALGGKVGFHPKGREIGTTRIKLSVEAKNDILFNSLPDSFPINVSHMQTVIEIPAGTRVLGNNDFESFHALRFADKAWGIQFHPEFNKQVMQIYIKERYNDIQSENLDADALYSQVLDTPDSQEILKGFSKLVSFPDNNL